jgi:hypothetical protein
MFVCMYVHTHVICTRGNENNGVCEACMEGNLINCRLNKKHCLLKILLKLSHCMIHMYRCKCIDTYFKFLNYFFISGVKRSSMSRAWKMKTRDERPKTWPTLQVLSHLHILCTYVHTWYNNWTNDGLILFLAFKLEVALHAKRYSQYAAAKIFSVARWPFFWSQSYDPELQRHD